MALETADLVEAGRQQLAGGLYVEAIASFSEAMKLCGQSYAEQLLLAELNMRMAIVLETLVALRQDGNTSPKWICYSYRERFGSILRELMPDGHVPATITQSVVKRDGKTISTMTCDTSAESRHEYHHKKHHEIKQDHAQLFWKSKIAFVATPEPDAETRRLTDKSF